MKYSGNSKVGYDFVALINCLTPSDHEEHKAYHFLSSYLTGKKITNIPVHVDNGRSLFHYLEVFLEHARAGKKFFLHIFAHGNHEGLEVSESGEYVPWQDLLPALDLINRSSGNSLLLNMTTCIGLTKKSIASWFPRFFFGIVGSNRILYDGEAILMNEYFYEQVIEGKNILVIISDIKKMLNTSSTDDIIYLYPNDEFSGPGLQLIRQATVAKLPWPPRRGRP